MMDITENLLPCPFCGGKASSICDSEGAKQRDEKEWSWKIVCSRCTASSSICHSERQAIQLWNKRFNEMETGKRKFRSGLTA